MTLTTEVYCLTVLEIGKSKFKVTANLIATDGSPLAEFSGGGGRSLRCLLFFFEVSNLKMGTIKDRNGLDLTEAGDIKKRWQEYMAELYKKDLHDPDNHDDVITNLEPDILGCKVKWTEGSMTTNKASGSDGIPVELFQILKMML